MVEDEDLESKKILANEVEKYRQTMGKPLVYRVHRSIKGGRKGDMLNKPLAWAVAIPIDGQMHSLVSVRNKRREWQDLNRLAIELRAMGFIEYEVRNNLSSN